MRGGKCGGKDGGKGADVVVGVSKWVRCRRFETMTLDAVLEGIKVRVNIR